MEYGKAKEAGFYPVLPGGDEKRQLIQQPPMQMSGYTTPPQLAVTTQPPDYLAWSLVNLICCFWPLGLVALIKSIDVRSHHAAGRYREAEVASNSAKLLNKIGFALGCAIAIAMTIITLFFIGVSIALPLALGNGNYTKWHHEHTSMHPMHG